MLREIFIRSLNESFPFRFKSGRRIFWSLFSSLSLATMVSYGSEAGVIYDVTLSLLSLSCDRLCRVYLRRLTCPHVPDSTVRHVLSSGVPRYQNGDVTRTPAAAGARCGCGLKHYWDGAEYDSPPTVVSWRTRSDWRGRARGGGLWAVCSFGSCGVRIII